MPRLKKDPKYVYGESIEKGSEGGMIGGQSTFRNLNKYMKKEFIGRLLFSVENSPYVGQWSPVIYATDKEALRHGLSLGKQYGFFEYDPIYRLVQQSIVVEK